MHPLEPERADHRAGGEAEHAVDRGRGGEDRAVLADEAHAVDRVLEHERHERLVDARRAGVRCGRMHSARVGGIGARRVHERNIDPSVPILRPDAVRSRPESAGIPAQIADQPPSTASTCPVT